MFGFGSLMHKDFIFSWLNSIQGQSGINNTLLKLQTNPSEVKLLKVCISQK